LNTDLINSYSLHGTVLYLGTPEGLQACELHDKTVVLIADLDGDGRVEIVVNEGDGRVVLSATQ